MAAPPHCPAVPTVLCIQCTALPLRAHTPLRFDAIYARSSFAGNERRLKEFDTFFELAAKEALKRGEVRPPSPPSSAAVPARW